MPDFLHKQVGHQHEDDLAALFRGQKATCQEALGPGWVCSICNSVSILASILTWYLLRSPAWGFRCLCRSWEIQQHLSTTSAACAHCRAMVVRLMFTSWSSENFLHKKHIYLRVASTRIFNSFIFWILYSKNWDTSFFFFLSAIKKLCYSFCITELLH